MEKFVLMMELKRDKVKDYIEIHKSSNVWPEIIELNKKAGVHKEEIFLFRNFVFIYMEAESYDEMVKIYSEDESIKEWDKIIIPMLKNKQESSESSKKIDLIYDYEDGKLLH